MNGTACHCEAGLGDRPDEIGAARSPTDMATHATILLIDDDPALGELPPPTSALPDFSAGDLTMNFKNRSITPRGEPVKLTPVECKLLSHVVRNAGRLMSPPDTTRPGKGPRLGRHEPRPRRVHQPYLIEA